VAKTGKRAEGADPDVVRSLDRRLDAQERTITALELQITSLQQQIGVLVARMDGAKIAKSYTPMKIDDAKEAVRENPGATFIVARELRHPVRLERGRSIRPRDFGGPDRMVQYLDAGLQLAQTD
jgi:hypothetical protein